MAERRPPLPPPKGQAPSLEHLWRQLIRLWEYTNAGHDGLPAPHVHTDGSGSVADPATAGGGSERMYAYFSSGA